MPRARAIRVAPKPKIVSAVWARTRKQPKRNRFIDTQLC